MNSTWLDRLARQVATDATRTRRGLARVGVGGGLAALRLADGDEALAACRAPKKGCAKGKQCCTGKCKKGKCARCPNGTVLLGTPPTACWPWLEWGGNGSGDGEFRQPNGVAVGGNGRIYVADGFNHRIQEFDGTLNPSAPGFFVRKWGKNSGAGGDGSSGVGDGEFNSPTSVALGAVGHVYITDLINNRLQEFDATLNPGAPGFFVRKWGKNGGAGSEGGGEGEFFFPSDLAVDGDGFVYVADLLNHRIVRMKPLPVASK